MKAAVLLALLFVQAAADEPPRLEEFRYAIELFGIRGRDHRVPGNRMRAAGFRSAV